MQSLVPCISIHHSFLSLNELEGHCLPITTNICNQNHTQTTEFHYFSEHTSDYTMMHKSSVSYFESSTTLTKIYSAQVLSEKLKM